MSAFYEVEAGLPRLKWSRLVHGYSAFSAAWYRRWRELHSAKYPASKSLLALDMLVEWAEAREAKP